jgi:hypothetical protein
LTLLGKISALPRRWRVLFAGAIVLLLAFFLYPFKTTIVPRWRLNVVDETRVQGVPDIRVTEHWQHYLLESEGHEEMQKTDQSGLVDFPARTIRASLGSRILRTIINFARQGANAKSGPYASVVVWGSFDYETTVAVYQPEAPTQTEIVVHRKK